MNTSQQRPDTQSETAEAKPIRLLEAAGEMLSPPKESPREQPDRLAIKNFLSVICPKRGGPGILGGGSNASSPYRRGHHSPDQSPTMKSKFFENLVA